MKCNVCNSTSEPGFDLCWNCSSPLDLSPEEAKVFTEKRRSQSDDRPISCLRCSANMRYAGIKRFYEGTKAVDFWMGPLFVNRELYDVYVCPNCGKVEFFLDGIGDENRPDNKVRKVKKPSIRRKE